MDATVIPPPRDTHKVRIEMTYEEAHYLSWIMWHGTRTLAPKTDKVRESIKVALYAVGIGPDR